MATYINGMDSIERELIAHDEHFHTREVWLGNAITEDSLTPYTVISGNGLYGTEVLLLDTTDTPVIAGNVFFDMHRISIESVDTATPYYLRIIWGTGTVGAAETAKQYTTSIIVPSGIGANVSGDPTDIKFPRVVAGTKVWAKCKNASNLAKIDIYIGLHEYRF